MRSILIVCVMVAVANADTAKPEPKPTKQEAAKAVGKWFDALDGADDLAPVVALTASSFTSSAYEEENDAPECKWSTATTPEKIKTAIKCMGKHRADKPDDEDWKKWQEWSAKVSKKSVVAVKRAKSKLDKIAKTSTVLSYHMDCAGNESQLVVGVTNEGGAAKVSLVMFERIFCGE